jgi:hypothetical protein
MNDDRFVDESITWPKEAFAQDGWKLFLRDAKETADTKEILVEMNKMNRSIDNAFDAKRNEEIQREKAKEELITAFMFDLRELILQAVPEFDAMTNDFIRENMWPEVIEERINTLLRIMKELTTAVFYNEHGHPHHQTFTTDQLLIHNKPKGIVAKEIEIVINSLKKVLNEKTSSQQE